MSVSATDSRLSRQTVDRYASLLEERGEQVAVANDTVFFKYNRMVEWLAPADHDAALAPQQARQLLEDLGGVLVRWGGGFREEGTGWYCVMCDELVGVPDNPSRNARSKIRRGLKNCRVEQIDADYMAAHGYAVHASAFDRYGGRYGADAEADFVRKTRTAARYPDLLHYWGVFADSTMVGYCTNYVFEDLEVAVSEVKFDPAHLRQYSSYALMQTMTEHYLRSGVRRVNAGFRSLAHDTAFQDHLITQFQYRRADLRLNVVFRKGYALGLTATRPFRGVLGRADSRLEALYELHRLSRVGG